MGQPSRRYLGNFVADDLGAGSLYASVSTVSGKTSRLRLPHLVVDPVDHSYSKRQQEGHLHMCLSRLCWFGGFAFDSRVAHTS